MNTEAEDWIEVGTIVAPQGLRGELRVYPSSDFPERFTEPGPRWLQHPETASVESVQLLQGRYLDGKNLYVITLQGVEDRNGAEALRGYKLIVPSCDRLPLDEDEYHVNDLINLEVYNQLTGENLGIVTDLFWAGHDLLEVKLHQQPENIPTSTKDLSEISRKSKRRRHQPKPQKPVTVLIPFVKEIVPVVDLNIGRLEILPPPGLLEVNKT